MGEKNLDFDTVIDRKNTKCLKYDFTEKRGMPKDILPLWVADMDFKTSSYVTEALCDMANYGIFGYSETAEEYFGVVKDWMKRRHNWEIEEEWLVKTPGIVFAVAMAVRSFTEAGDTVLIQQPVYYPFRNVIVDNGRRMVSNDLKQDTDGRYFIDYEDFEQKIVSEKVKLFILCSPHNPVGRVWTKEELTRLGDICLKHGVIVVSDEIHSDFIFEGEHTVFTSLKKEFLKNSIVCTSPSKTFNIAGLQISNIFIANPRLRERFREEIAKTGYDESNLAGITACEAAYRNGEEWLDAVLKYISENMDYTQEFLAEKAPKVKMRKPEGTYLVWLDFRDCGWSDAEVNDKVIHEAGLWLDAGNIFGETGEGFQRVNVACPRSTLTEALERLAAVFGEEN